MPPLLAPYRALGVNVLLALAFLACLAVVCQALSVGCPSDSLQISNPGKKAEARVLSQDLDIPVRVLVCKQTDEPFYNILSIIKVELTQIYT